MTWREPLIESIGDWTSDDEDKTPRATIVFTRFAIDLGMRAFFQTTADELSRAGTSLFLGKADRERIDAALTAPGAPRRPR